MLFCFFTWKLLIYFCSLVWKKLILPVEKFSLKGKIKRNLQAIGKYLLECKELVKFYCRHHLQGAFSRGTHLALLPLGVRKSGLFMFFGRFRMRRGWRPLPSPMWVTDICRIHASVTNASQAPGRKRLEDAQHTEGSCAGEGPVGRCCSLVRTHQKFSGRHWWQGDGWTRWSRRSFPTWMIPW